MYNYDEFIAKATLYYKRADVAEDDATKGIWQLLAFEFVIRAPLAKLSPTLLANTDGGGNVSILHAVGIPVQVSRVTSITSSVVISRLQYIIPALGEDGAKAARTVLSVRNDELHSSNAAVSTTDRGEWLPSMLDVVEVVCSHLGMQVADLISADQIAEAYEYRETVRKDVQVGVMRKIKNAQEFALKLTGEEVATRLKGIPPFAKVQECPACKSSSFMRGMSLPQTVKASFDELADEINYEFSATVVSAKCAVCMLVLDSTAEVMAAGLSRVQRSQSSEPRYDGWENAISIEEIAEQLEASGYHEPEYMDE